MQEKPIIFSPDMVRAILDDRKCQTRRIVKPQPDEEDSELDLKCSWYAPTIIVKGMEEPGPEVFGFSSLERGWKCQYGAPGDRLWVRESWMLHESNPNGLIVAKYTVCDGEEYWLVPTNKELEKMGYPEPSRRIRPAMFMPRWASRLTLEITDVKVERLQDIDNDGAIAEGIEKADSGGCYFAYKNYMGGSDYLSPTRSFRSLWNSIHGPGAWDLNPWVWALTFRKVNP